jgi:hypothetical protein
VEWVMKTTPTHGVLVLICDTLLSSQGSGAHLNLASRQDFGATFLTYRFLRTRSNRLGGRVGPRGSLSVPAGPALLGALSAAWCPLLPCGGSTLCQRSLRGQIGHPCQGSALRHTAQNRCSAVTLPYDNTRIPPTDRLPRRSTSHSPPRRSALVGAYSASLTRTLLR